jgi:hypothetical protein
MTVATCLAIVLQLQGDPVATLGMDGKWNVPDWDKLAEFEQTASTASDVCFARELRLQRSSLDLTDKVDNTCPSPDLVASEEAADAIHEAFERLYHADPVSKVCDVQVVR